MKVGIVIIIILLFNACMPILLADTSDQKNNGFEKGIPWQPFKPLKKATFVQFDKDSLIDDFAYLASIPANVFSEGDILNT